MNIKSIYFKDRDGQTPLPAELHKGLKQKHIQNLGELDEAEELNFALGLSWLNNQTKPWANVDFWKEFHRACLSDVWDWAGKLRTHELQNEEFDRVWKIQIDIKELEGNLNFWLKNPEEDVRALIARFHERLLTIHPFANGNGRWSRLLINHVTLQLKQSSPTWGRQYELEPKKRRAVYIDAVQEARKNGNFKPLISFVWG